MPTRLVSSSSGLQSDAAIRVLDVFVIQACFVLCVLDFSPMQYMCYVSKYVFMLCYVQTVPDFGPVSGICPQIFDIVNGFFNRCRGASYWPDVG